MLYLFNTTICPNEGLFLNKKISTDVAVHLFWTNGFVNTAPIGTGSYPDDLSPNFVSAIGHQGSADAFNAIFKPNEAQAVNVNRIQVTMQPGDEAICLKVLGRLPEGQILTFEELEKLGFEFYLLSRVE